MKVIKKPLNVAGQCNLCKAEYMIKPKELRKATFLVYNRPYLKCKYCKSIEVQVFLND
jgi:hypothetical protein